MIRYAILTKSDILSLKPLWEGLNRLHEERSVNFKEHFRDNSFERRIEKFLGLADDHLFIAAARHNDAIIGYVVATLSEDGNGEIDSIFVEGQFRAAGIGAALMKRALAWLAANGCSDIIVGVADGNEEAFEFYRRFGFLPRMTILKRKGDGNEDGL